MSNDAHDHTPQHGAAAEQAHQQPQAFFRPKPDGATDPAGEAGWYLERERERRGLSLQTVSRAIGVHPQHVRAIELGMLENLPEREQALKMIGAYARFLGFDPQPLVEHFSTCLSEAAMPQQGQGAGGGARIIPFPLIERLRDFTRTPGGMGASALAVVLLFGGLVWGFWPAGDAAAPRQAAQMSAADRNAGGNAADNATGNTAGNAANAPVEQAAPAEDTAAQADTRLAAQPSDAAATQDTAAEAQHADPIAALITRTIGTVEEPSAAAREATAGREQPAQPQQPAPPVQKAKALPLPPPPMPAEQAASSVPAGTSTGNAEASATASAGDAPISPDAVRPLNDVPGSGIALRAAEQIWLRLEDDNGAPWYVGFLKAGQVLALPADKALRLSASDVHRLEWYVNGQRMGRLGKRGADFLSEPLGALYKQSGLKVPGAKNTAG